MSEKLPTLDTLILHVQGSQPGGDQLDRLDNAVQLAETVRNLAEHLVGYFVDEARKAGTPWAQIGEHLGVSRQAVQKRFAPPAAGTKGKMPDFFERMVPAGRRVIVLAQEEARHRMAPRIGTEHILLGLCGRRDATGSLALARCGASAETVIAAVNGRIGMRGDQVETEKLPFTPDGLRVLQHALREALRLDHDYVGTGHLALACLTVAEGAAAQILGNLGVSYDALREAVSELSVDADRPAT